MQGSLQRVRAVLAGETPDQPPLFDLLRNDAVIAHFAGEAAVPGGDANVVYRAYAPAIDATRPLVRIPQKESSGTLSDGRRQEFKRWTSWTEPTRYADSDAYAAAMRQWLDQTPTWSDSRQEAQQRDLQSMCDLSRQLGEVFLMPAAPGVNLMGMYDHVGLEHFCYYLVDCPEVIDACMQRQADMAAAWVKHLPADHGIEAVFVGDDIAFRSGTLFDPDWLRKRYMPRLAQVMAAYRARGIRVLFHSDGNLWSVLDDLVDAGIDGLNPLEVMADMDPVRVHARHRSLFLVGGIDVSQLLPFATPQQVRETVWQTLAGTGGRLMVGSSSELHNDVPLANFLAMREAVLTWKG